MRFPYLGAARVKYLISMMEHRRQLGRLRGSKPGAIPATASQSAVRSAAETPHFGGFNSRTATVDRLP